jgi:hypothetical protein
VRCNIERAWQQGEAIRTLPPIGRQGTLQSGRRLPMEYTGMVTAIVAMISFGFVAAIILGMI